MLFLYRLLLSLALPVLLIRLGLRALRGAEPAAALAERLGGGAPSAPGAIWLHAASNGELISAQPLIAALFAARPGLRLVVTTNTVTARAMALGWGDERITVRAAPLDTRWALARFLARHRPAALIVVENELWPNRLLGCAARGLPVLAIGARMSARSARRWRKTGLGPRLMRAVTALSAQDPASEAEFRALGLPARATLPIVNLKTAVRLPEPDVSLGWPRETTLLAASTHEGEEEIVLDAFARARTANPSLRLILAPRHPRRGPEIARLITARGLAFATRSTGAPATAPVLLADTMGEMTNWYAAAGICFIGGTLAPKGGHTPFEPAAQGCALLHGPSVFNHGDAFAALDAARGAIRVEDADSLAAGFALAPAAQTDLARAARRALAALAAEGAPARLAKALLARIDTPKRR
ncbi:3-deoxy-D-manno-octulosonic acid transferase [Paenirhodobacter hankyongi]|uniref:3-deoxy-D-manno-octulosonic acid transferase n=1 Tax=Paenirhodobacter hankyongi TaxID=2294033 RepID=A0A421BT03_9RHOB|nr:glycosyltransferase N-terminal domain-containing protein [Sinirhodobacter hankyongi]RLL71372.1 3-deoxy-D-manno-octulosonic acid transferase [Sinirhodobacter hankyongi]